MQKIEKNILGFIIEEVIEIEKESVLCQIENFYIHRDRYLVQLACYPEMLYVPLIAHVP